MPAAGVIVGAAQGVAKALGIGGGVPLTRYGKYLSTLAQRRGWPPDRADKYGREAEKDIAAGESSYSFVVTGPEGSPVERLWAERVIGQVAALQPPLSASEWSGFSNTDRAGNALSRGLIPPRGAAQPSLNGVQTAGPFGSIGVGSTTPGGVYTLPTQQVTAPNLFPLAIGAALILLLAMRGK